MKDPIKDFIDTKKKMEKKYPGYTIGVDIAEPGLDFSIANKDCDCRGNMNINNPKEPFCPCCGGNNPSYEPKSV